jgi:hypothetical protein
VMIRFLVCLDAFSDRNLLHIPIIQVVIWDIVEPIGMKVLCSTGRDVQEKKLH